MSRPLSKERLQYAQNRLEDIINAKAAKAAGPQPPRPRSLTPKEMYKQIQKGVAVIKPFAELEKMHSYSRWDKFFDFEPVDQEKHDAYKQWTQRYEAAKEKYRKRAKHFNDRLVFQGAEEALMALQAFEDEE